MVVHERALEWMQFVAARQPLDRADLPAFGLHGEHEARTHRLAVDDDRTAAAHTVLATDVGAGLAAVVADRIDERAARLDADRILAPVDYERDGGLPGHVLISAAARSAARM